MRTIVTMTFSALGETKDSRQIHQESVTLIKRLRWFNSTYTIFAATTLLFCARRNRESPECPSWLELVRNSVEILEAMNENVVAEQSATIIKRCLTRLEEDQVVELVRDGKETNFFDVAFDEGMFELQQSMPFDASCWEGTGAFSWAVDAAISSSEGMFARPDS